MGTTQPDETVRVAVNTISSNSFRIGILLDSSQALLELEWRDCQFEVELTTILISSMEFAESSATNIFDDLRIVEGP